MDLQALAIIFLVSLLILCLMVILLMADRKSEPRLAKAAMIWCPIRQQRADITVINSSVAGMRGRAVLRCSLLRPDDDCSQGCLSGQPMQVT